MIVYEYVDRRGRGVITEWYDSELQLRHRAAFDRKLEDLVTGDEPPPGLLRGSVSYRGRRYPNTFKFTVDCGVALRPLACRGPFLPEAAWTLLVPVIEVGNRYDPAVFQQAEQRRIEVLADRRRRKIFRDESHYA